MSKIPKKYTKGLSQKDKKKQVKSIKKSKRLYSKNKYISRPKLKSFKSRKSSWTQKFKNKYPNAKTLDQIAKQTKIPKKALQEVKKKVWELIIQVDQDQIKLHKVGVKQECMLLLWVLLVQEK